jgi:hypothetical protein
MCCKKQIKCIFLPRWESGTITIEGEKKMKIAAYYRPPKQVSDIDNKLFKEEVNGLGIKRKKDCWFRFNWFAGYV